VRIPAEAVTGDWSELSSSMKNARKTAIETKAKVCNKIFKRKPPPLPFWKILTTSIERLIKKINVSFFTYTRLFWGDDALQQD